MERARDEFLPRAAFSADEHGRSPGGDAPHDIEDVTHRLGFSEETRRRGLRGRWRRVHDP
jgi:hypothetical protein